MCLVDTVVIPPSPPDCTKQCPLQWALQCVCHATTSGYATINHHVVYLFQRSFVLLRVVRCHLLLSRAGACSFCVLELFCNAVHSLVVPRVVACCCVFLFSNVVSCCYPSVFSCPVLVRVNFVFSNFVVPRTLSCRVFARHYLRRPRSVFLRGVRFCSVVSSRTHRACCEHFIRVGSHRYSCQTVHSGACVVASALAWLVA
jgi:hypothetical protein